MLTHRSNTRQGLSGDDAGEVQRHASSARPHQADVLVRAWPPATHAILSVWPRRRPYRCAAVRFHARAHFLPAKCCRQRATNLTADRKSMADGAPCVCLGLFWFVAGPLSRARWRASGLRTAERDSPRGRVHFSTPGKVGEGAPETASQTPNRTRSLYARPYKMYAVDSPAPETEVKLINVRRSSSSGLWGSYRRFCLAVTHVLDQTPRSFYLFFSFTRAHIRDFNFRWRFRFVRVGQRGIRGGRGMRLRRF